MWSPEGRPFHTQPCDKSFSFSGETTDTLVLEGGTTY